MITLSAGGNGRFEALYRKYYPRVYRYMRKCGLPDSEAQDLAQETFKRIFETFATYRGEAEWSFIETTAKNVLFNYMRARKTFKRNAPTVEIDDPNFNEEPHAPEEPDYAERQQSADRQKRLREAIAALPDGQREAMQLWLSEIKYEAIARLLGISVDAVKSRLRDAKRALRAKLGDGLPEDEE